MRAINIKGFTMVEVLVAMLILSISLLGMAGLQIMSLQSSGSSLSRSQATMMAYDLAERMRRNPDQTAFYITNLNGTITSPNCLSSGCSAEELAREDILQWQTSLQDINGLATIANASNEITLEISWTESQYGNGLSDQSYEMTFEL